ncbi:hypothetical protein [Streptomyces sp. NPDC006863]|uniref:hypothetical protein n=1 Tax=Streptomyces sp. NPDC006863 TaxID=3154779 RepID=UPI0033F6047F
MSLKRSGEGARQDAKSPLPAVAGQADLLTEWREVGLITSSQYATFTRTAKPTAKVH